MREQDQPDYYAVLGVPVDATAADVSRAFRRQAFRDHPDRGGDAEAFRHLYRARETLLDPTRRAAYDRRRRVDGAGRSRSAAGHRDGQAPASTPAADQRPAAEDPFEWAAGAGPNTDQTTHRTGDPWVFSEPFSAYEPGMSWRRGDRFAWWKPHR